MNTVETLTSVCSIVSVVIVLVIYTSIAIELVMYIQTARRAGMQRFIEWTSVLTFGSIAGLVIGFNLHMPMSLPPSQDMVVATLLSQLVAGWVGHVFSNHVGCMVMKMNRYLPKQADQQRRIFDILTLSGSSSSRQQ
jgi:hypothetical protein